jgi:hypothetical protein
LFKIMNLLMSSTGGLRVGGDGGGGGGGDGGFCVVDGFSTGTGKVTGGLGPICCPLSVL